MALGRISQWFSAAVDVVLPRHCSACGRPLRADEHYLCRECMFAMPFTRYETLPFNAFDQRFAGIVPVERAVSYFFYERNSPYASILHDIKYHNMPEMGTWLAERAVERMRPSGFFDGVDAIVPVPLHFTKRATRGYNQSEEIAKGLSQATGAPVVNALRARHASVSQTHKNASERAQAVRDNFTATGKAAALEGKTVILVDDVVTTGSTLIACAQALLAVAPSSVLRAFTLAAAHLD